MDHFGVKLINKGKQFNLNRDEFAITNTKPSLPYFKSLAERNAYVDEAGTTYREEWCIEYRELCLKNFDLNMEYFSLLNQQEFNDSLNHFLNKYNKFIEIHDLNEYIGIEGYYIMVLDKYKQVYIGKSNDITKRIKQHWSRTKPFDRTLLPMYEYKKSCFSIDFFRALDTTRIFVWEKKMSNGIEEELISNFPSVFCTNRIGGDITTAIQALATINKRNLIT